MSIAESDHCVTLCVEPPTDASAATLLRDAVRHEIAARHEECLRWFCTHPAMPDDLLLEIYYSGLCLDELGHRQGPRALLEKLANEANYPEAILTLAIQLYTDFNASTEEFSRFVNQHADHFWMLDTLVRRSASSAEKEAVLEDTIAAHPEADHLKQVLQVNRWARRAAQTDDREEMEQLFATGEPAIWLALAGNQATPRRLMEQLADVKDVRLARRIRNRAREALETT